MSQTQQPMTAQMYAAGMLAKYVMDCIGELPDDERRGMYDTARGAFGDGDDFRAIIRRTFGFAPAMDEFLVEMWRDNVARFAARGEPIDAFQFGLFVVRRHWWHLIADEESAAD